MENNAQGGGWTCGNTKLSWDKVPAIIEVEDDPPDGAEEYG